MRVRPKITHSFAPRATIEESAWNGLPNGHREHGVGLVVAVHDVEARIEALNPRVLQLQRFDLAGYYGPLHRGCREHHLSGAGMQLRDVLEIVRQACAQVLCLAHIDNAAILVPELVNARISGDTPRRRAIGGGISH